jgi:hypothetical protein
VPGPTALDRGFRLFQDRLRAGEVDHDAGPGAIGGSSAHGSSGSSGSGGCRGCVGSVGPYGPVRSGGARGAGGPIRSVGGRPRDPAPAGRNPAVRGRARPGRRPDPGTPRPHAEVEGGRYASQSRDSESRDQDHYVRPEYRAWWEVLGALARHTRPMTRAFPRYRERPGTRLINTDSDSPPGTVSYDSKTSALS